MNVILPPKKGNKRRMFIYVLILVVCVLAVAIAVYQFFADEKLEVILGFTSASEEQYEKLKAEFDDLFTNSIENHDNNSASIKKVNNDKDLVYETYLKQENSNNNYNIDVHIPYINIENDVVKGYNDEIQKQFLNVSEAILQTENSNIIYSVEYKAYLVDNILSVIIRSNFKQGSSAQRVIVLTFNYDINNNKEVSLKELLNKKGLSEETATSKIETEIKRAEEQAEELNNLGYNIYKRDSKSDIYKLENTTEFFTDGNYLYLVYPYGNRAETSEMDLVIF